MKKQQEFAYNSALKNIQKIGNITEIPSLQVAFSEEELNVLDWFFDQLDTEQLRQYDSLNTGETIDVNSVLITARLGNKEVGIRIGFAMNLLDITIFHKDRFSSEFEKNFSLLRHAFRDDPIPENKISNIVIDELYNARKKSNNNVIKQGRIEYINNDLGITLYLPSAWKDLYSVKEGEYGVTFYNTNNRDYGGLLFSVYYTDEVVDRPETVLIGEFNGKYLWLSRPSDVQFSDANDELMKEYQLMYEGVEEIKNSITINN